MRDGACSKKIARSESENVWCGLIVTCIVFFNCSMFCCTLLYVLSSFAIILMGKRERERADCFA